MGTPKGGDTKTSSRPCIWGITDENYITKAITNPQSPVLLSSYDNADGELLSQGHVGASITYYFRGVVADILYQRRAGKMGLFGGSAPRLVPTGVEPK